MELLRNANAVLAVIAVFLLIFRWQAAWGQVKSRRLFVALAVFPVLVGIGSGLNSVLALKPGPLTPVVTAAYLYLCWVCIRWDLGEESS